jgi:transposase
LHQRNLVPPGAGSPFAVERRSWWDSLDIPPSEKLRVRHDFAILEHLDPLIAEGEDECVRLSVLEPWASDMPFLLQIPGMWLVNALILLSAIGDITCFPSPQHLVG